MEWARFRKYARRMRELWRCSTSDRLSLETFSAIQLYTINEPLLPNLKTLEIMEIEAWFVPFIPLFLSQRTTSITLEFESNLAEATVASMITTLPTLCPDLQVISLQDTPRDPMVITAVSGMLLATNRNTLQELDINSPLTKEASDVLYKLPNLRSLSVAIQRGAPLPSASLPNLTDLKIWCDNEDDWPRLFHGATFGKLRSVCFHPQSEQIGDFLGAFERAALSSSVQNTLSSFCIFTQHSWNPNYPSLLPFTQLVYLVIQFSCDGGCSSRVDDDIVIRLSRAMPKLESLELGDTSCGQITGGVTTKGLLSLAHRCPKLSTLRLHLQVASLSGPPGIPGMTPTAGPTAPWTDCALTELGVGRAPMPEGSEMIIALTLLQIFPRLNYILCINRRWKGVEDAINRSRGIIDYSSKQRPFATPRNTVNDRFTGATLERSD